MSEAQLHRAIRDAHAAGRIAIEVDVTAVSRAGSPSFRTTDVVVPWFAAVAVAAWLAATYGIVTAAAFFVLAAGIIVMLVVPWNRRRAANRTIGFALSRLEHWQTLWRMGGLRLSRAGGDSCRAPDGDWRGFARALAAD
ncbi:MAG: hypothetical protein BroJett029_21980 [Alphaproteobacteria bacterium]|nr:MAG: hypothetical protein BroJett029_21980 [Alphaproteobacteria bacterium]